MAVLGATGIVAIAVAAAAFEENGTMETIFIVGSIASIDGRCVMHGDPWSLRFDVDPVISPKTRRFCGPAQGSTAS